MEKFDLQNILLRKKLVNLVDDTIIVWKVNNNYNAKVTLTGNRTLSLQGLEEGDYGTIRVIQDATGNRTLTLPNNSIVMGTTGSSSVTLSTGANQFDILSFYYDGTYIFWNISKY